MLQPNRHGGSYRYSFNGKEGDDEIKGKGNQLDFGARSYDSRIGRFLSLDRKKAQFPFMSAYCYAGNSPIMFIDREGNDPIDFRLKSLLSENSSWATGLSAGIGDGVLETGGTAYTAFEYYGPNFAISMLKDWYYKGDGFQKYKQDWKMISGLTQAVTNSEVRTQMYNSIKEELGAWSDKLTFGGTNAEAGYTQGKLVFEILALVIGAEEVALFAKTGKFSLNALKLLRHARIRKKYKSFSDLWNDTDAIPGRKDKKSKQRDYSGEGDAQEHFDNLVEQMGGKKSDVQTSDTGVQVYTNKETGESINLHKSTGVGNQPDGQMTLGTTTISSEGAKVQNKIRFKKK